MFIRESHRWPRKILIGGVQRLFQQHRSEAVYPLSSGVSAFAGCGHVVPHALGSNGPILLQKAFGDFCRIVIRSR
jgi:hypothetical protein